VFVTQLDKKNVHIIKAEIDFLKNI